MKARQISEAEGYRTLPKHVLDARIADMEARPDASSNESLRLLREERGRRSELAVDVKRGQFELHIHTMRDDGTVIRRLVGSYIGLEQAQDRAIATVARGMANITGYVIGFTITPVGETEVE